MTTLGLHLTRLFLLRIAIVTAGFVALMLVLDLLAHSDEVLKASGDAPLALFGYAALRLPETIVRALPLSVLLGSLLAMVGLVRHSELTAIRAIGVSQLRLLVAIVPAGLAIAVPQLWIRDQLLPPALDALIAEGLADEDQFVTRDQQGRIWLRAGTDIANLRTMDLKERILHQVVVFRRDEEGRVVERLSAPVAYATHDGWRLENVLVADPGSASQRRADSVVWRLGPDIDDLKLAERHPRTMPIAALWRFAGGGSGAAPAYLYAIWLQKRFAEPVATVLLLVLAVILGQNLHQRAGATMVLVGGVVAGFAFFIVDGLVMTLGEAGLMPPIIGAWGPTLLFAVVAAMVALHRETLTR
jgi:lipopolysaccharide export system permease protein